MYLESKTNQIFGIACLEKKLRVKDLFKLNQTGYGVWESMLTSNKGLEDLIYLNKIKTGNTQP